MYRLKQRTDLSVHGLIVSCVRMVTGISVSLQFCNIKIVVFHAHGQDQSGFNVRMVLAQNKQHFYIVSALVGHQLSGLASRSTISFSLWP